MPPCSGRTRNDNGNSLSEVVHLLLSKKACEHQVKEFRAADDCFNQSTLSLKLFNGVWKNLMKDGNKSGAKNLVM